MWEDWQLLLGLINTVYWYSSGILLLNTSQSEKKTLECLKLELEQLQPNSLPQIERVKSHVKSCLVSARSLSMSAVLPDGPAVQDGGGSPALCALHQTQRRPTGAVFLPGEGDGAAALHGDPGDGQHPPPGLLPPHPLSRVCQQVPTASREATPNVFWALTRPGGGAGGASRAQHHTETPILSLDQGTCWAEQEAD